MCEPLKKFQSAFICLFPSFFFFFQQTQDGSVKCKLYAIDVYVMYSSYTSILQLYSTLFLEFLFMNFPKGRKAYLYYNTLLIFLITLITI